MECQFDDTISIWTVGHSTRPIEDFLAILTVYGIEELVDVRHFPGSRTYPQFNVDELSHSLLAAGIDYVALPELGGRRRPRPDSPNTMWRNASFRGYADYMSTSEFTDGIDRLLTIAHTRRTAIMCAEAVWWRCHRALIADFLMSIGGTVIHILDAAKSTRHPYTSAARIVNGRLSYESRNPQSELPLSPL